MRIAPLWTHISQLECKDSDEYQAQIKIELLELDEGFGANSLFSILRMFDILLLYNVGPTSYHAMHKLPWLPNKVSVLSHSLALLTKSSDCCDWRS